MSAEATYWAWQQEVKSTVKLTLLALANCHNEATGQCNPSITYISKRTGLNRKTVISSLQSLEEMGLIIPQRAAGNSTEYLLSTSTKNGTTGQATSTKKGSTKNGTSTENGSTQKRTGVVPKTGQEQYQKRDTKGIERKGKEYIYENNPIKLNESDYKKIVETYPNLNILEELNQLSLELRGQKNWFMALNAKLKYRNEKAKNENGKSTASRRSESASKYHDFDKATDF